MGLLGQIADGEASGLGRQGEHRGDRRPHPRLLDVHPGQPPGAVLRGLGQASSVPASRPLTCAACTTLRKSITIRWSSASMIESFSRRLPHCRAFT
jgi:hypothetical protein